MLIEVVGGVKIRLDVRRGKQQISDFVIVVAARNSGNIRRRHFAAVVVAEGIGVAGY